MPPIPRHSQPTIVGIIPLTNEGLDAELRLIEDVEKSLHAGFPEGKVVMLPDFVVGARSAGLLHGTTVHLGARDVSVGNCKAESGIPDAKTLSDIGVEFVDVSQDDNKIKQKTEEVVKNGMKPLLCMKAFAEPGPASQQFSRAYDILLEQVKAVVGTMRPRELVILREAFYRPRNTQKTIEHDVESEAESTIQLVRSTLQKKQLVDGVDISYGILKRIQRVEDLSK